jgi:DNA-binding NtrC family response regulator
VERLLLLSESEVDGEAVHMALPGLRSGTPSAGTFAAQVESFERQAIEAALARHGNNMTETAKSLGLERSHLYKKCAALGIRHQQARNE